MLFSRIVSLSQPVLRCWMRIRGVALGRGVRLNGLVLVTRSAGGSIRLGDRVVLTSLHTHNTLEARGPVVLKTLAPRASIEIGADTGITSATISAASSVRIGQRVLLGAGVLITDSDHHFVDLGDVGTRRRAGMPPSDERHAVVIEDDVFIGARTVILKGVRIGRGAVIGAGSVVTADVPGRVVAAGNPCRVLRELRSA